MIIETFKGAFSGGIEYETKVSKSEVLNISKFETVQNSPNITI